jgi:hypothetical protein
VNGIPYSIPASGDKAFNGEWQYDQWLNDPSVSASVRTARAAMSLRENQNTYSISNPVGALKLLSVAFNGWFDGLHSLGSTTDLDALQAFALIYLFFEEEGERGIEGLGPTGNDQMFEMITPAWLSGAPQSTAGMNTMFAKLWTHWAQD